MNTLKNIIKYYNNKNFKNLSEKAYEMLEEMIILFVLKPKDIYSETELSELIGIGRTPVREAIKKLEYSHMVEIIPRRGIKIADIRLEEFFLQMEVRRLVEKLVYVRASKFSTPTEREHFIKMADKYYEATNTGNEIDAIRIDNEFHHFVAECARNPFAKNVLMPFHSLARRLYYMQYKSNADLINQNNKLHSDLMRAIATGDSNKVSELADDLFDHTEELIKLQYDFLTGIY